jgi:hypothetical protein
MSQRQESATQPATREQIEARAYTIWENEGKPHGRDVAHWCQAKQEVLANQKGGSASIESTSAPATPEPEAAHPTRHAA